MQKPTTKLTLGDIDEIPLPILDLFPDLFFKIKSTGELVWANSAWIDKGLHGLNQNLNCSIHQYLTYDGIRKISQSINNLLDGTLTEVCIETELVVPDQNNYWGQLFLAVGEQAPDKEPMLWGRVVDITAYKEQITSLEKKTDQYEALLDNIPADIVVFDNEQRYKYINKSAIKDDALRNWMIDKDDFDFCRYRNLPMEKAERRRHKFIEMLRNKKTNSYEEHTHKDGKDIYNLRISHPVLDEQGEVIYTIGYGLNISQLKESELIIFKQRLAMEASSEGIALLDSEGKYYYLNETHVKRFGYSQENELLGKTWEVLYPEDEKKRIHKDIFPLLTANGSWSGETTGISKDGKPVIQEISLTALPDGGLVCMTRDLSERKRQEKELEKLALVASKTNSLVIITDEKGIIEWINDGFTKVTGYTIDEALGKHPNQLLAGPLTDPNTQKAVYESVSFGKPYTGEILNYTKTGKEIWLYMDIMPIHDDKGIVTNFIAVQSDITPIKKAEENAQKLLLKERHLAELKIQFVNLASHEFRTPLAGIQTSADVISLIASQLNPATQEKMAKYLDKINFEIDRLKGIMSNILKSGQIEAGVVKANRKPINLTHVVLEALEYFEPHIGKNHIALQIEGKERFMNLDPELCLQVMTNLISNALKYSEGKQAPDITIKYQAEDVEIAVRDYGIGIPAEEQSSIFLSFFRASNAETIRGTGLGLMLIKHYIEIQNGELSFTSKQGQGSCFFVKFNNQNHTHV